MKRYYRPEWGDNWREHFAVDRINGIPGHELKFDNQKLVNYYLRVGYDQRWLLAHLQAAPRFSSRRTRCRWRTTSPLRWCCRAKA